MCCQMCIAIPSGRRVHLFFLKNSKIMYTPGTIANSQGMPTEINKNGGIAVEKKVIP